MGEGFLQWGQKQFTHFMYSDTQKGTIHPREQIPTNVNDFNILKVNDFNILKFVYARTDTNEFHTPARQMSEN